VLRADVCPVLVPARLQVIVEWRALTVSALDVIVEELRSRLGVDAAAFPLVKVHTTSPLAVTCDMNTVISSV
jgi:hypothetical protein